MRSMIVGCLEECLSFCVIPFFVSKVPIQTSLRGYFPGFPKISFLIPSLGYRPPRMIVCDSENGSWSMFFEWSKNYDNQQFLSTFEFDCCKLKLPKEHKTSLSE